jgi:predicted nucleotidyltransferase
MSDFGLDDSEIRLIRSVLAKQAAIDRAVVYGSRAMGKWKPYSDIDIALFGEIGWREIGNAKEELEELPLPYKFDVLHYETLKHQGLKDHIDRVGKDLYVREKERA